MLEAGTHGVKCCGEKLVDRGDGYFYCALCATLYEEAEIKAAIHLAIETLKKLVEALQ